jgi:hypothetical protein
VDNNSHNNGDVRRRSPTESSNNPNHSPPDPSLPAPQAQQPLPPPLPVQNLPPLPPVVPQPSGPVISKFELAAKKIEKFTSIVIPSLFIVFNFIYWPWLIQSANYYDHRRANTLCHAL